MGRYCRLLGWMSFSFILLISTIVSANERPVVLVGGYEFPPFLYLKNNQASGITMDLIDALNQHQDEVTLKFTPTSPKRRYFDFKEHRFDLMFFESLVWGWKEYDIEASKVFLTGGEVYITLSHSDKNQSYFSNFEGKSLVGVLGYHYGFADFNADTDFLAKNFNMRTVSSPESILFQISSEKSDIGVITESYLRTQLATDPRWQKRLLISDKKDQEYRHTILARKGGQVPIGKINKWLDEMKKNGTLRSLFLRYNLQKNMM